jgi:hypothetical protein
VIEPRVGDERGKIRGTPGRHLRVGGRAERKRETRQPRR